MQWDATVNGRVAIPVNRSSALGTIGGGWGEREEGRGPCADWLRRASLMNLAWFCSTASHCF